ncbi:exodeoxyribonuclease I [Chitiniphilus purpureus]|uniref:Exodeoxyribonuclease I n=1 Tax=Chitiniphilus purpureus TaxID=2981137 RepID=A0ABY6DR26_9NEIS|nr:exodeoxyribonuclease I [Chitiniphilus sp. CD1]UXY16830.1 exodeoxyribonuclease I [Chitiniphilus sp. CD1]
MHTFLWHDYETFGRVPRRDRPAQFAGIRTDGQLNEIGEPIELFCRPTPDWLPDPESCLLTGITPQQCLARGVPEREFAQRIQAVLAQPGTIGVGYNTLRFDDEVTRFLFWRNLLDPYAREWQNECGRWDLLDVVRTTWALRPQGITWPTHDDGRPSFKLEDLTRANRIGHDSAHDAVSDVRATIELARLIRTLQPRLFDFCLSLRKKEAVLAQIGTEPRPLLHISGMYGTERGCLALVWPVGWHPQNKNELIVWDLSCDPEELFTLDAETIRARLFVRSDALPEGMARLPIKTIHINKSPIVIANLKTLSPERAAHWGIDPEQALAYAARFQDGPDLGERWRAVYQRDAQGPSDVDEDLYGGFLGNDDRRLLARLATLSGAELAGERVRFGDPRLEELLFRYRARNFPQTLSDDERTRWETLRSKRLLHGQDGYLTLELYCERIDALAELADERGEKLLAQLYDYAELIAPEYQ